jgi:sulfoxide reductase heme-binding subunit YedZ
MSLTGVVRDHGGRLSPLKLVTLVLVLVPGVLLAWQWYAGVLGPHATMEVIHGTGLLAIRFILIALAVTPARALLDWSRVVQLRRMLGVTAACYAVAHFVMFFVEHNWDVGFVVGEIALRFYLTIGFVTLLGLLALAITSTDGWQKRLGQKWKRLHKIIYVLAVLALFHYAMQLKANVTDAVFLAGLFVWLMLWRALPRRYQTKIWPLPELAVGAGLVAALAEAAWYTVRNGVKPLLVLQANLDVSYGPRPAVAVALLGLALVVVVVARRGIKRLRLPGGAMRRARNPI